MKNLKVSMKLIVGFLIVAVMTAIVGVVGIVGMRQIDGAMEDMYTLQTVPMPEMGKVSELIQRQRACMREFIIGSAVDDFDLIDDAKARADEYRDATLVHLALYRETIRSDEALKIFDEGVDLFNTDFKECMDLIYTLAKGDDDPADLYNIMREYTPAVNKIVENFDLCLEMKIDTAADANDASSALADGMLILIIVVLVVAIILSVVFALYISKLISNPLTVLSSFMKKAGTTGDITLTAQDSANIQLYSQTKDEIGQTINASAMFVKRITDISEVLTNIAEGDLTHSIDLLSPSDVMGTAIQTMVENLNNMFTEINVSANQVATGSKQVSDGAQALAQGSTEQAASVEELSASIGDIATSTKSNAETAAKTAKLSGEIRDNAEKGSRQMDDMIAAVQDINEASLSISKIIKTIDDIAFQTNILALNAAVEAARAGQHGKGFAVVAEEVRNLASKSADAAKDTGDMIQNSMTKAELGSQIAGETAASLKEIVAGISESSDLISQIAQASEDQSLAISQINTGVDQVAHVIQQNSATAQQSAAASEQMSGQSDMLQGLIARFKLKDSGHGTLPSHSSGPVMHISDKTANTEPSIGFDDDYGKY